MWGKWWANSWVLVGTMLIVQHEGLALSTLHPNTLSIGGETNPSVLALHWPNTCTLSRVVTQ